MMMMMMMIIIIIIIRPSNTKTYVTQSGSRHPSGQPDPGKLYPMQVPPLDGTNEPTTRRTPADLH